MAYISVPSNFRDWIDAARQLSNAVNSLGRGRSNAVGSLTLTNSTTLTTVSDVNMGESSVPTFTPTNSAAIAEGVVGAVTRSNGSFVVEHSNDTTTRTFVYAILG